MSTRFTEGGGAGGGATTIGGLNDVSTSNVQPNEILQYNSTSGAWENAALNITGGLRYKGDLDATNPPDLSNASQGDFYVISVAGTRFGFDWEVRDHLLVNEDMGGTVTDSKIDKIDNTEPAIFADNVNLAPTLQGNGLSVDVSGGPGSLSRLKVVESQLDNTTIQNGAGYITGVTALDDIGNVDTSAKSGTNNVLVWDGTSSWDAAQLTAAQVDNSAGTFLENLNSESINDLSDVNTSSASAANNALVYNSSATPPRWEAAAFPSVSGSLSISTDASNTNTSQTLVPNTAYYFYGPTVRTATLTTPLLSALSNGDEIRIVAPRPNITFRFDVPNGSTNAGIFRGGHNEQSYNTSAGGTFDLTLNGQSISLVYVSSLSAFVMDLQTDKLNSLGDVDTSSASAANNALVYNSSATPPRWEAAAFPATSVAALDDIGNVDTSAKSGTNNVLVWDGTSSWDAAQLTAAQVDNSAGTFLENLNSESINDLSDVNTSSASAANNALVYNSSATPPRWEAAAFPATSVAALDDIGNVDTSAKSGTNNVLVWDGTSSWDAAQLTAAQVDNSAGTFLENLNSESINDLSDVNTSSASAANNALVYNSSATPPRWEAAAFPATSVAALDDIGNVDTSAKSGTNNVLVWDGTSSWDAAQLTAAQVDNSAGTFLENLNSESINDLSDVNTSSASAANNALVYNSSATPPRWEAAAFPATSVAALDDIGNVDTSAKSGTNNVLVWDGTSSWDAAQLTAAQISGLGTAATSPTTDFLSGTGPDELGGDLDVGSSSIVSSSGASIAITPDGAGKVVLDSDVSIQSGEIDLKNSGSVSNIKLYCESSNQHAVTVRSAAHSAYNAGSWTLTLPGNDGGPNQVLTTDGNGNTSWTTASGSGASRPDVDTSLTHVGSPHSLTAPASTSTLEEIYIVNSGTSAVTINLPAVTAALEGFKYNIKRVGSNNVVISPDGATDKIEGSTNDQTLSVDYSALTLVCDGVDGWYII